MKSNYMKNSLYCEKDSECRYFKTGCGGCAFTLQNIYSGEKRLKFERKCELTTDCYWGTRATTCEENSCVGYNIDAECRKECTEPEFESYEAFLQCMDVCKKQRLSDIAN